MNPVFELKNLNAGYEEIKVLHDINLTVREGDFIAIIGPNGAGKSTMLKTMAGLIKPSSGEILFKACPMSRYSRRDLALNFSVVRQFQENLLPFTVIDFIKLGLSKITDNSTKNSQTPRFFVNFYGFSPNTYCRNVDHHLYSDHRRNKIAISDLFVLTGVRRPLQCIDSSNFIQED